jgi:hypothetical protein
LRHVGIRLIEGDDAGHVGAVVLHKCVIITRYLKGFDKAVGISRVSAADGRQYS